MFVNFEVEAYRGLPSGPNMTAGRRSAWIPRVTFRFILAVAALLMPVCDGIAAPSSRNAHVLLSKVVRVRAIAPPYRLAGHSVLVVRGTRGGLVFPPPLVTAHGIPTPFRKYPTRGTTFAQT